MNNSILNDVLKEYEKKRLSNTYKLEKRKQELYTSNPELKEIDNKLSEFSINTAKCILQNNSEKYLKDLKKEVQFLKNKKINRKVCNNTKKNNCFLQLCRNINVCLCKIIAMVRVLL